MSLLKPPDIRSADGAFSLEDFYAVPEMNQFLYMPTRTFWQGEAVDRILPKIKMPYKQNGKQVMLKPTIWLLQSRCVVQVTWVPGLPEIIEDRLLSDGGWKAHPRARVLNLYEPPTIVHGDAAQATPWIEHFRRAYPEDAEAGMDWFAHRVQRPGEKINHALVLGGSDGIGKDWLSQALKLAVGFKNFQEISPTELMGQYTPFVKAVVLRMSEAHDLGESGRADRYALYERIKIYAAAPPDVLVCVDKYIRRYYVPNVLGLLITTNHKTDGVYLSPTDRRHLVAWSDLTKEDFNAEFWNERWRWLLHEGGANHVAAYLMQRDLSAFDPCAVPRQTTAAFEIIHASRPPEDAELADALDEMGNGEGRPDICTLATIIQTQCGAGLIWLLDRRHRRSIPYRLESCGYIAIRNPDAKDGQWKINGRRQTLYAKAGLKPEQRLQAAKVYVAQQTKTAGSS